MFHGRTPSHLIPCPTLVKLEQISLSFLNKLWTAAAIRAEKRRPEGPLKPSSSNILKYNMRALQSGCILRKWVKITSQYSKPKLENMSQSAGGETSRPPQTGPFIFSRYNTRQHHQCCCLRSWTTTAIKTLRPMLQYFEVLGTMCLGCGRYLWQNFGGGIGASSFFDRRYTLRGDSMFAGPRRRWCCTCCVPRTKH